MSQLLLGKTALITGGTRGIGKAIAKRFAQEGAAVAIFGTNAEKGAQVVEQLQSFAKVKFYQVDVSNAIQVEEAITAASLDLGPIEILVNNAGITRDNLLMRMSSEEWDRVMDTNLKSIFHTCRSVVRPMLKARSGKIINITSVVGLMGNAGQSNYAASKAGMVGFSKSLAKEVAARGINVNCIAPGFIETDMTDALNEKQKEAVLSQIPMQKMGSAEDIASAALFLASSLADYVTGQVLTVDGGMVM